VVEVLWLVGITIVLLVSAIAGYLSAKRKGEMVEVARRNGLEYSDNDPFNCTRVAFPLFRRGEGRHAEHVMWREAPTGPVRGFDYSCWWEHRAQDGSTSRRYQHFTCALAFTNGSWPDLSVHREGLLDRMVDTLGDTDIDFESEEFNRTFVVRCRDRRFATALIDPQMMATMLATRGRLSFDFKGRWLLVWCDRVKPRYVPPIMRVAETLAGRIPPVVRELYPSTLVDGEGKALPPVDHLAPDIALDPDLDVDRPFETRGGSPFETIFKALEDDGIEYDLDGKQLPEREENPWGNGP
jgi:hypothetical protein